MSRPAITIGSDALVGAAWNQMRTRKIRHLPVVDEKGSLVGIVTDRDLRQVIIVSITPRPGGRRRVESSTTRM